MGFFQKLQAGLAKTRDNFAGKVAGVFGLGYVSAELFEELEEALIQADVGVLTACELAETLQRLSLIHI